MFPIDKKSEEIPSMLIFLVEFSAQNLFRPDAVAVFVICIFIKVLHKTEQIVGRVCHCFKKETKKSFVYKTFLLELWCRFSVTAAKFK
jgi:hypothetical protein